MEEQTVVERVVDLWNKEGGWIPGAAYARLAEVLGVEVNALDHWDSDLRAYVKGGKTQCKETESGGVRCEVWLSTPDEEHQHWISDETIQQGRPFYQHFDLSDY